MCKKSDEIPQGKLRGQLHIFFELTWPSSCAVQVKHHPLQWCRGWCHPALLFFVSLLRHCCNSHNILPSVLPGLVHGNTWQLTTPAHQRFWSYFRLWIDTKLCSHPWGRSSAPVKRMPGRAAQALAPRVMYLARFSMAVSSPGYKKGFAAPRYEAYCKIWIKLKKTKEIVDTISIP